MLARAELDEPAIMMLASEIFGKAGGDLGSSGETLLAQELQKRGILRYSRGRITILDRAALEAHACECYHAIKNLALKFRS